MASAHGKVILCGEHAVVYGAPALACGLDHGASARATPRSRSELVIDGQLVEAESDTGRAFVALTASLGLSPHRVEVEVRIPTGVGLGASACIGIAIAKSLLETEAASGNAERALAAADAWERVFHGNPSGIDAAAAYYGGCIQFERGKGITPLCLSRPLRLAVAVAGPPSATKEMVHAVRQLRERKPAQFEQVVEAIRALVHNARTCLELGNLEALGQLLDYNQMLLAGWFVSTTEIEDCCRLARTAGAYGAKLTGAGGGGCVIAVAPETGSEAILAAWRARGYRCFESVVGASEHHAHEGCAHHPADAADEPAKEGSSP